MNQEGNDDGDLRRYLLGELNEAEQQRLEERLLTERELFDLLPVIEDELVDDYLGGQLSSDERARFESYFVSTPDRRRKLSFAMALRRYVTAEVAAGEEATITPPAAVRSGRPRWWRQAFSSPFLQIAAAALVLLAIGFVAWRIILRQPQESKGMAALREAYPDQRPTESRITGFDYAPPPPTTRGPERGKFDNLALDRAKALIQLEANEHPSAQTFHDLGRLYLAAREFDKAMNQFESALKLDDKNAQVHSDYGVALLESGKDHESKEERGKSLEQYSKGLEHLNRAVDLDASLLEALFNRALCHEYMMLPPEQSEKDWHLYLEKDPSSRWADEARRRLEDLEKRKNKVSQTREELYEEFLRAYRAGDRSTAWEALCKGRARVGNSTVEKLVDDFLEMSTAASSQESEEKLAALVYAGKLEVENAGDRFTRDLAQFYKRAGRTQQAALRRARGLVTTGQVQIAQSDFKSAFESYEQAKRAFDEVGNKCESRCADYWLGICCVQQIDPERGPLTFRQVAEDCEKDNYKWLYVRASNALANRNLMLNEYSRAITYGSRSRTLAKRIQDTYGLVLALSDLVKAYSSLGAHKEALDHVQQLLALTTETPLEPIQTCLCFARTAWTLYSEGLVSASLDYQKAALELALELKELTMICTSYVHLGMIHAKLNNFEEAFANVRCALETAKARSDDRAGSLMVAYSTLHLGSLYRQIQDFPAAITNYTRSVEIYTELKHPALIHEAHKGLVLSHIASGNIASASEELIKTLQYYEDHRSKIWDQSNRNTFFDLENDVYDIAIDLEYSRKGSAEAAFDYSELSKGRSLRDLIHRVRAGIGDDADFGPRTVTQPLDFVQIRERLPRQAQVIQYAVLDNKLLIWFLKASSPLQTREQAIDAKALGKLVQDYSLLVSRPSSDISAVSGLATELYKLLIGPVESLLDRNAQLIIVPDKVLNNVPFPSLLSPDTGKYLIEDQSLTLSPSSSVLIDCSDEASRKGKTNQESALGVGVTHLNQPEYWNLPDLRSAAREAKAVVGNYPSSVCLIGGHAKKSEVLREIEKANVIHLASHFIASDASPLRSRLLLVNGPGDSPNKTTNGVLEASEIFNMKLPAAKLAVLSACRTGVERYYRGEGAISLAHAFIAAGVPLVVASLWAVDSDATAELMISFHGNRKHQTASSAEALRRAQLAMLNGGDRRYRHPYYWASFNLIGGYAGY